MPDKNQTLASRDLAVVWHPCTQMKDHEHVPLIPIRRGLGAYLEDYEGKRYLDAISSWWVNLFGHVHPLINSRIKDQLDTLEHVLLAGFTHQPVIELSERLVEIAPPGLSRCFYTDNGSSAVDAALKMSFHYFRNCGHAKKTRFIHLSNSYHGETLGALAVGGVSLYRDTYAPLLMQTISVPSPDCYYCETGSTWEEHSRRMFTLMRQTLEQHSHEVCAVIIEPLVQCAGSMRMYDPVYLTLLREACDEFDVHLIADEIAVGFGRTGTLFACEQAQITPDFLCLGKGLTGGYLTLATVLTHETIYQCFYDDYVHQRAFLHSHSYTGNPLACAAALATLDIFKQQDVLAQNRKLAAHMHRVSTPLSEHPHVAEARQTGMIVAFELVKDKATRTPYDWRERRGLRVYQHALQEGVLLRPLGDVIYWMPPYIVSGEDLDHLAQVTLNAINHAT